MMMSTEPKGEKGNPTRPSVEAVRLATGKDWQTWFEILDQAGAQGMDHKSIVSLLKGYQAVSPWWQQQITVSYEQERGLREVHQMPDGYQVSRSKTIATPISSAYAAWAEAEQREAWLGPVNLQIRTARLDKSLRITWSKQNELVEVNFYPKSEHKCQVTVQHSKLDNSQQAEKMKIYWSDALARLKTHLEGRV
jgi:hypothetical protein